MLDTLINVKARLGITTNTYDIFLTQQITLISDVIEAYCRRKFKEADYVQTFYRDECPATYRMELFHFPVSEVSAIKEDNVLVDATTYRLNKPTGLVKSICRYFFFYAKETVVEYTAGYENVPTPILSVLDDIVGGRYNKKVSGVDLNFGSDVQSISIPGAISIAFDYTLKDDTRAAAYGSIIGNNANILDDWRSERSVIGSGKLEYVEEA